MRRPFVSLVFVGVVMLVVLSVLSSTSAIERGFTNDSGRMIRQITWTIDRSGTVYRAATVDESRLNGWPADTFLVLGSSDEVLRQRALPVVLGGAIVDRIPLEAPSITTGIEFHELYLDRELPKTTVPTFYHLNIGSNHRASGLMKIGSNAMASASGHVTLDDSGGLYARVSYATRAESITREVFAGEEHIQLESIALPDGSLPSAKDLLIVSRPARTLNLPGADDFTVPPPPNPQPLAMFGTIYWCQLHPTNWKSLIAESAFEIRAGFRKSLAVQGPGTTDTGWDIVLATSWCMFFDSNSNSMNSVDEAKWCEWGLKQSGDGCDPHTCTDALGFDYPLTGCYRRSACFANKAWDAVEYADRYLLLPDLLLVQAQTWGGLQDAVEEAAVPTCPDDEIPEGVGIVCGLAKSSTAGDRAGASVTPGRPYSLWPPDEDILAACLNPFTWTHEVGHNYNGFHVSEFMNAPHNSGCGQYKTLMNTIQNILADTCTVNAFSVDMRDHMVSTCIPGTCPRSSLYVDHLP